MVGKMSEESQEFDRDLMKAVKKRKEIEYKYCNCGNLLLTESEQRDDICRQCLK